MRVASATGTSSMAGVRGLLPMVPIFVCLAAFPAAHAVQLRGRHSSDGLLSVGALSASQQGMDHTYDGVYRLRQKNTERYLDAYEQAFFLNGATPRPGYEVITRPAGFVPVSDGMDHTQFWLIEEDLSNTYSLMQYTSGRFLQALQEASEKWQHDRIAVVRDVNMSEHNTDQRWFIHKNPNSSSQVEVRLMDATNRFYLDSHQSGAQDFQVMLRDYEDSNSQVWVLEKVYSSPVSLMDGLYMIQQVATDRKLDAYEPGKADTFCVTRPVEFHDTQKWIIRHARGEVYSIQQSASGQLLGADPNGSAADFSVNYTVVSRPWQGDNAQKWLFLRVSFDEFVLLHVPSGRLMDAYTYNETTVAGKFYHRDFRVHTAAPTLKGLDGNISSQIWKIRKLASFPSIDGVYRMKQRSSGRYLESMTGAVPTYAVTGTAKEGKSQLWDIRGVEGDVYRISEVGDAADQLVLGATDGAIAPPHNYTAFVNPLFVLGTPSAKLQQWYAVSQGDGAFSFRHGGSFRFLDANENEQDGWSAVTHDWNGGDSQVWELERVADRCLEMLHVCPAFFECGSQDDWCGGKIACGPTPDGSCAKNNDITGKQYRCNEDHACTCDPKTECEGDCGEEDDGCGGQIMCGLYGKCHPKFSNKLTGEPANCTAVSKFITLSAAPAASAPAPAPAPAARPAIVSVTLSYCGCIPRVNCDAPLASGGPAPAPAPALASASPWCEEVDDGCGGILKCGMCDYVPPDPPGGMVPQAPAPAFVFAPAPVPAPAPLCMSKQKCDEGLECGEQPDGCGGNITCGNHSGACLDPPKLTCTEAQTCVCTPLECIGRCGIVPDGCGNHIPCRCGLANELCDEDQQTCVHVPQPPPPAWLFEPKPGPSPGGPAPAPAPAPRARGRAWARRARPAAGAAARGRRSADPRRKARWPTRTCKVCGCRSRPARCRTFQYTRAACRRKSAPPCTSTSAGPSKLRCGSHK
mmetsp:Transcript_75361/g.245087  ORF Transcript_75361/g.245087 Transcript_75361/m.245087 type:complete len:972 (+) Transcript_75361:136-3051(+)